MQKKLVELLYITILFVLIFGLVTWRVYVHYSTELDAVRAELLECQASISGGQ